MVGSLGIETIIVGAWLHRYQFVEAQQSEEEEEILTRYESQDHNVSATEQVESNNHPKPSVTDSQLIGWEFKIVRASSNIFHNPAIFHRLCEEEAQLGWILLEKLDDRRVRFKRLIAMRDMERSELPRFDPYRSHYGPQSNLLTWLGAILFLTAMILPAFLGYNLVLNSFTKSPGNLRDLLPESSPDYPMPAESPPSP